MEYEFCTNIWYAEVLEENNIIYRSGSQGILSRRDEYSVNANELPCENGTKIVNLTLSIKITDYILKNVPSVYCRIQFNGTEIINGIIVHLLKESPTTNLPTNTAGLSLLPLTTSQQCPPTCTGSESTLSSTAGNIKPFLFLLCIIQCILCYILSLTIS